MKMTIFKNQFYIYIFFLSLVLPFVPLNVSAQNNTVSKDSSIYRFYALENQISNININTKQEEVKSLVKVGDPVPVLAVVFNEQEDITQKQKDSKAKVEASIKDINNNSRLRYFLIGSNLNVLRFQSVQVQDQVYRLKILSLGENTDINQVQINNQLIIAEAEKIKIDKFILEQSGKFSLLGWLVRII